jgi:Ser/Thr protein kinase RdoA (MazF antagonist)
MDVVAAVVDLARKLGVVVEEPVPLRSTNNHVIWLRPSAVVAKIYAANRRSTDELGVARVLADAGAPVVPPAEGVGRQVYRVGDREVTFWRYESQENISEPSPESLAQALGALHEALMTLGVNGPTRTYEEQITDAIHALDRPEFAPELRGDDRGLLRRALRTGQVTLAKTIDTGRIIHGSPHRMNIVIVAGSPRFIDFETVQRGPLEWDLAHLEPEVAAHYPGRLDFDALALCRILVGATTSTWCWEGLHRGPDMRNHAEHHLAVVRSALN